MRKKTPPRRAPLPFEVRNLNHRAPVTRREFLGRGMLATSGVVIGAGSLLGMLARPRRAFGQTPPPPLDTDIMNLVNGSTASGGCNIHAGAGKVPFIAFDLGGGGNIAGSNALVGGMGGQLDFLTTAGYNKLGIPGGMIPNSGGANSFVDQSLGLAMHGDSAYLRGIQSIVAATTMGGVNGAVIPAISQTDTDLNPHNPMYGINSAGAAGALVVLIGTEATVSGGNSMAPSYMINQSVLPTVVTRPSDVTGLVSTGQLVAAGALDQTAAVDVLESAVRISNMKLAQVSATGNPALDPSVQNGVQCSYVDAAYLVDQYGNASATLDPTQDSLIVGSDGSGGIFTTAQMQDSDFLATASVMKMVIDGYAGAGTIEMGGYDYHDSTRATGETRDFKAGQCIGACLEYAARRGVPLMIYVFSDGSLASSGMIDTSMAGRDKGVWTADNTATAASLMLVYDPSGSRPTALQNQIGNYNSDGTVNATGSIAANAVNLLAETVVLNYMALHGQEGNFESMVWAGGVPQGLGSADNYKSLIAFTQLASVSGPGGTVPGL